MLVLLEKTCCKLCGMPRKNGVDHECDPRGISLRNGMNAILDNQEKKNNPPYIYKATDSKLYNKVKVRCLCGKHV